MTSNSTAADQAPPRSILKKTHDPIQSIPSLPVPKSDRERRRLQTAVDHARLIQQQKETMIKNLDAIEELSDYPASTTCTQVEAARFVELVALLQPGEYDMLIEERNINGRCGHTLCPNPHRKVDRRTWLRPKGSENWCSNDCAKKALYVKAQLNETPAWERAGGIAPSIALYENLRPSDATSSKNLDVKSSDAVELAAERGEKASSFKPARILTANVLEKSTPRITTAPDSAGTGLHDLIEGYQPKQKAGKKTFFVEDDDRIEAAEGSMY
ncbi:hypothetical protein H2203_001075 [Taxawa tesnikishii (nom. ined.)]|nr:hypothetical protein H2203_001075 [Dothideales sp. JES 119]